MHSPFTPVAHLQKDTTSHDLHHELNPQPTNTPNHMKPNLTIIRKFLIGTIMAAAISFEAPAAPAATAPTSVPAAPGAKLPKTGAGPESASSNIGLWLIGGGLLAASGFGLIVTAQRRQGLK